MARDQSPLQLPVRALIAAACLGLAACGERAPDAGEPHSHNGEMHSHDGGEPHSHDEGEAVQPAAAPDAHDEGEDHSHEADAGDHDHGEDADHDHAHDQASGAGTVHVHGAAEMSVAVTGDTLSLGLITPLANLGLSESAPQDEAARDAQAAVREALTDPATLFDIDPAAACATQDASILFDYDGAHGEAVIDYTLACANGVPGRIGFAGFKAYPGIEDVALVILTDAGTTGRTLDAGDAEIRLR